MEEDRIRKPRRSNSSPLGLLPTRWRSSAPSNNDRPGKSVPVLSSQSSLSWFQREGRNSSRVGRANPPLRFSVKKWARNTNAVRSPWLTLKKLILYVVHWQHLAKSQEYAGFLECGSSSFRNQPPPGWVLQRISRRGGFMSQPCSTAVFRLRSLTNPRQSPLNCVRAENCAPRRAKK